MRIQSTFPIQLEQMAHKSLPLSVHVYCLVVVKLFHQARYSLHSSHHRENQRYQSLIGAAWCEVSATAIHFAPMTLTDIGASFHRVGPAQS